MNERERMRAVLVILIIGAVLVLAACQTTSIPATGDNTAEQESPSIESSGDDQTLVIYSGRNENLVDPLLKLYAEESGVQVEVRYGDTAEMAATILEEGQNSPADVFFGQDAGSLGALAEVGRCAALPAEVTEGVDPRFVSADNQWVGTSGRARVLVYNSEEVAVNDLPASVFDLTDEQWRGRVGWAPTNGSFQAFVTAMRVNAGEEAARTWLQDMIANDVQVYPNNASIVEATGKGEITAGLVNHYYLFRFLSEDADFPAANYFFPSGDVGAMINVAGVCVIDTSENVEQAQDFVRFLLSDSAQQFFSDETNEYPLTGENVTPNPALKPLAEIDTPDFDLSDLDDLQGTLEMLQETGALD